MKIGKSFFVAGVVTTLAMACGGSTPTSSSVTGTVGGETLVAQDALFTNDLGGAVTGTGIALSSTANLCADTQANQAHKNARMLAFIVQDPGGGPIKAPGTFQIAAGFGAWLSLDATCVSQSTTATGGSATVTSVSGSEMAGTFSLDFGSDHVAGSFVAGACPVQALGGSTAPTCI